MNEFRNFPFTCATRPYFVPNYKFLGKSEELHKIYSQNLSSLHRTLKCGTKEDLTEHVKENFQNYLFRILGQFIM